MKKILAILAVFVFIFGCIGPSEEQVKAQLDSLLGDIEEKYSSSNEKLADENNLNIDESAAQIVLAVDAFEDSVNEYCNYYEANKGVLTANDKLDYEEKCKKYSSASVCHSSLKEFVESMLVFTKEMETSIEYNQDIIDSCYGVAGSAGEVYSVCYLFEDEYPEMYAELPSAVKEINDPNMEKDLGLNCKFLGG